MTMKVQEHTISVERKNHPNAKRYPCRSTHEVLEAGRKLMTSLSPEDLELLSQNDLILDEEDTEELFDEIKENDIIGLGVIKTDGFYSNTYRIDKIHAKEDWMSCENALTKELEEISFQDISIGLALGFAEILYREDKPFGVSSHYDFTYKIEYEAKEDDEESEDNTGSAGGSGEGVEASKGVDAGGEATSIESDEEDGNSEEAEEVSESSPEPTLDFHECYYAFGFDTASMTHYVTITPAKLWDDENIVCDQGSADHLAKKLGLMPFQESMYEYDLQYTESQLRQLLVAFRAKENTDLVS